MYRCPFCERSFKQLYALAIHMHQKHRFTGDPVCPACGKRFKNYHGLQSHITKNVNDPEHAKYYILFATRRRGTRKLTLKEWWEKLKL